MLRIAICCGGGFSSSALAKHLEDDVINHGLDDKAKFIFIPFHYLESRQDEVDVAMLCPHLEWKMKQTAHKYHIPLYIIPPKLYGLMAAGDFIDDAEDVLAIWENTHTNPVTFEDEPVPLRIKRMVSHRRHLRGERWIPPVK